MQIRLDPARLEILAANNEGSVLGILASRMAAAGLTISLDEPDLVALAETDTDALGELLRDTTFVGEGTGCYSNFDVGPGWAAIDTIPPIVLFELMGDFALEPREVARARAYHHQELGLSVYWFWDGDGTLLFDAPSFTLVNHDCKTSDWRSVCLLAEIKGRWNYDDLVAQGILA